MSFSTVFGFHNQSTADKHHLPLPDGSRIKAYSLNLLHLAGYVPLLGIFAGAMRMLFVHRSNISNRSYALGMIARGVLEIVGGGLLLAVPDILVSICRHCCEQRKEYEPA